MAAPAEGAQTAFILELGLSLRLAGTHPPGSPPVSEITRDLFALLRAMAAEGLEALHLEFQDDGLRAGGRLLPFEYAGVAQLWEHFRTRGVSSLQIPARLPVDELWQFLLVMGGSREQLDAFGGARRGLAAAGCANIQVHEATAEPAQPTKTTNPWADIADFGEASRTWNLEVDVDGAVEQVPIHPAGRAEPTEPAPPVAPVSARPFAPPRPPPEPASPAEADNPFAASAAEERDDDLLSGDTVKSTLDGEDETWTVLDRVTREVVRATRPDGAQAAARALLEAWRRVSTAQLKEGASLDPRVLEVIPRLDPALRAAVIFDLANSGAAQRQLCAGIPADLLCEAIVEGLLAPFTHFVARAPAVVMATEKTPERRAILRVVGKLVARAGPELRSMWEKVVARVDA